MAADFGKMNLIPSDEEIERLLSPWIARRMKTGEPAWQEIRQSEFKRMARKARWRWLRSARSLLTGAYRSVGFVDKQYNRTWASVPLPDIEAKSEWEKLEYYEWKDEGFILRYGGGIAIYQELLVRAIETIKPLQVLEVGSGMGTNVLVLSSIFSKIEFTGLELTEAGVTRARESQNTAQLPEPLAKLSPRTITDPTAFRKAQFIQGNAARMPFEDNRFDLVYTKKALEQMESVKEDALREIRRVCKGYVVFIEPLLDSNQDELRRISKKAKQHISLSVADLSRFGFDPVFHYAGWPQKITAGYDFAIAKVKG